MPIDEESEYFQTLHWQEISVPGGDSETIAMEMWYWTTLEWLISEFELTEEGVVEFALAVPHGETLAENVKYAIYVLFHSYDKVFNPEEYDGSGYDEHDPDYVEVQDALELMGMDASYSQEELKKQYMTRIAKIHPDLIDQFNEAYEILKSEIEKKA